jgi:hypothetical protein
VIFKVKKLKITMNTAKATDLCDKIPKFSGQKEDVQLEEFVRQIENFADLVQWVDNEDGENGAICYLLEKQTKSGE